MIMDSPSPQPFNWSLAGAGIVAVLAAQAYFHQGDRRGMSDRLAQVVNDDGLYMKNLVLVLGAIGVSAYAAYKQPELRPAAVMWWWL